MVAVASKQDVYRAEWMLENIMATNAPYTVHGSTVVLPDEIKFSDLEHIRVYVGRVIDVVNIELGRNHTHPKVRLGRKDLRKKAYCTGSDIVLPHRESGAWAWTRTVVLHELAHFLTPGHGHDATFAGMLTYLFEIAISPETAFVYSTLLMESGMNPIRPEGIAA